MTQKKPKTEVISKDYKCIVCCEKLSIGAKKCINCGSYQAAWKNHSSYVAGMLGLVTATFAAGAYLYSSIKQEFFWEDKAAVYEYYGDSNVVISNFGDGPIFVKGIDIRFESVTGTFFQEYLQLNTFIEKDTVKPIELQTKKNRLAAELQFSDVSKFNSPEEYNQANNFSGTTQEMIEGKKCYLRSIAEENSEVIKMFKRNVGKSFYTSNGTGTLQFFSIKKGDLISKRFKVQSYLQESKNIGCALIYKNVTGKVYPVTIK